MKPEILYQDKHIAVVVKPAGVMSESPGMPELLRDSLGGQFFCVHRLDAGVGGVMVYARSGQAAARPPPGIPAEPPALPGVMPEELTAPHPGSGPKAVAASTKRASAKVCWRL